MFKWYQKIKKIKYENDGVKHENKEEKVTFSQQNRWAKVVTFLIWDI